MKAAWMSAVILLSVLVCSFGHAEAFLHTELETQFISNTYLDDSQERDVVFHPNLELELDFKDIWAIGYTGRMEIYAQHTDLFFHGHELYFIGNPTFGDEDEHAFLVMPYVGTGRNTSTFESVNLLYTGLSTSLELSLSEYVLWTSSASTEYRWFYDNQQNSTLDTWIRSGLTISLPSRTSISPRVALGHRFYPDPVVLTDEPWDMQLKPGIRLAQGLGDLSGIWVDYEYLYTFNDNNLVLGEMLNAEMSFAGTDFMFSGHAVSLGGKRIFGEHWTASLEALYLQRLYDGLEVIDAATGSPSGQQRQDDRIGGTGNLRYERETGRDGQILFAMVIYYEYLRQFSNDTWFDSDLHVGSFSVSIDW